MLENMHETREFSPVLCAKLRTADVRRACHFGRGDVPRTGPNGDRRKTTCFRRAYASILSKWLETPCFRNASFSLKASSPLLALTESFPHESFALTCDQNGMVLTRNFSRGEVPQMAMFSSAQATSAVLSRVCAVQDSRPFWQKQRNSPNESATQDHRSGRNLLRQMAADGVGGLCRQIGWNHDDNAYQVITGAFFLWDTLASDAKRLVG